MNELTGRVALITGGGRGIGRALALGFARAGAEVVGVSRTPAEVEAVAREIQGAGGAAQVRRCDVSSVDDVASLAEWLADRYGRLDVLANNAGVRMNHVGDLTSYATPILELQVADWDRMLAVNLRGPFLTCKLLGPLLQEAGRASVINLSAQAGLRGEAGRVPYCASKFGLEGFTQALAAEWRAHNIAVNTLSPGIPVFTDALKRELHRRNPALRNLRPEVLVPPALFLAQQDASGTTGQHVNAFEWVQAHALGGWERWQADYERDVAGLSPLPPGAS